MDSVILFQKALDQTGTIVSGVTIDQLQGPTPCEKWNVQALLNHTITCVEMFDGAARGRSYDGSIFARDNVGDDPLAAYGERAANLRQALTAPGITEAIWNMPFGNIPGEVAICVATMEIAQHGWDIARATGQQAEFAADVTESAVGTARANAERLRAAGVVGSAVDCPLDAPGQDQLAAFLGRRVE